MFAAWSVERWLRFVAGSMVMLSLLLAVLVNVRWLWLTGFVGLNLFQSAFTDWCPMMTFLMARGKKRAAA